MELGLEFELELHLDVWLELELELHLEQSRMVQSSRAEWSEMW